MLETKMRCIAWPRSEKEIHDEVLSMTEEANKVDVEGLKET